MGCRALVSSPRLWRIRALAIVSLAIAVSPSAASFNPQKIDFGLKLTGQLKGQDIGLLQVRTGAARQRPVFRLHSQRARGSSSNGLPPSTGAPCRRSLTHIDSDQGLGIGEQGSGVVRD